VVLERVLVEGAHALLLLLLYKWAQKKDKKDGMSVRRKILHF